MCWLSQGISSFFPTQFLCLFVLLNTVYLFLNYTSTNKCGMWNKCEGLYNETTQSSWSCSLVWCVLFYCAFCTTVINITNSKLGASVANCRVSPSLHRVGFSVSFHFCSPTQTCSKWSTAKPVRCSTPKLVIITL